MSNIDAIDAIVGRFISASDDARNAFIDELRAETKRQTKRLRAERDEQAARTDRLPFLLDALEAGRAEIERLRGEIKAMQKAHAADIERLCTRWGWRSTFDIEIVNDHTPVLRYFGEVPL